MGCRDGDAGTGKRCKELLGIPDAGKGEHAAAGERGDCLRIRFEVRVEHRNVFVPRRRHDAASTESALIGCGPITFEAREDAGTSG